MSIVAAQSPMSSAEHNGIRSTVFIHSILSLQALLEDLYKLPSNPPPIYLDARGVRNGRIKELQIMVMPSHTLYIIKESQLHDIAFSAIIDNFECSLRQLLESKSIWKIGFDLRQLSRVLFDQFFVFLNGVYDLQIMELASRDQGVPKKYLAGFEKCVGQDIPSSNTFKQRWAESINVHTSDSPGHAAQKKLMRRIEVFPELWTVYRHRLGPPSETFWLRHARFESNDRLKDSRSQIKINPRSQALSPVL